jgi:hypothetical protein
MAFGIDDAISGVSKLLDDGMNKIWPDPAAKATAEATLMKAQTDAALAMMTQQMSAIVAEANSKDPWTSRARPSFMYVMYIMILCSVPMGVLAAFSPATAVTIAQGMQAWLAAIPNALWGTFGTAYAGYVIARSYEKGQGVSK